MFENCNAKYGTRMLDIRDHMRVVMRNPEVFKLHTSSARAHTQNSASETF